MWHASVQHLFCKLHLKMHLLHSCRRVPTKKKDRRTDRQTDGRTNIHDIHMYVLNLCNTWISYIISLVGWYVWFLICLYDCDSVRIKDLMNMHLSWFLLPQFQAYNEKMILMLVVGEVFFLFKYSFLWS